MSGRNNRLKCLECLNPVDCYYVKHIAVLAGGQGSNEFGKTPQDLGKTSLTPNIF